MAVDTSCVLKSRQNRPASTPYGTVQDTLQYTRALPLTVCYPQWLRAAKCNCPSFYLRVYIGTQLAKEYYHTVTALQFFYNEPLIR